MKIRSWMVVVAGTAALTFGGVVAPAAAHASSRASSLCPTFKGTYRIQNDASSHYLTNEGYKTGMETTGSASTFRVYSCNGLYQFQVSGANDLCIEFSAADADYVIADTCYSTRASQLWDVYLGGNNQRMDSSDNNCGMWAYDVSGAIAECATSSEPGQTWKVYAHAA
jgi:hypothetical protein